MSGKQDLAKEQLIKIIEKLEENPNDRVGILADVGVTALGAAGAAAAAAALGTTTASIPIITAATGIGMLVATAPIAMVASAAVVGGAAIYGVSRLIKDGGFNEGKRKQILNEYKDKLREAEAKERQANFDENDKTKLYSFLKEALIHNLISPDDAQCLIQAVESGSIPLNEAYTLIEQVLSDTQIKQSKKLVTICPNCSQKLSAPSDLGQLNLTCPKCKHSWLWIPN